MLRLLLIALAAIVLAAVGIQVGRNARTPRGPRLVDVNKPSPQLEAAIDKARASLHEFRSRVQARSEKDTAFFLRVRILGPSNRPEIVWLKNVTYLAGSFEGELGEPAINMPQTSVGTKIRVLASQIVDWRINRRGGGYDGFFTEHAVGK